MMDQVQKVVKSCASCIKHEAPVQTAPLLLLEAKFPLDLVHVDFTTIETTMELDKTPKVVNVLVVQDHFMKYVMAFITPDQKVKTVA